MGPVIPVRLGCRQRFSSLSWTGLAVPQTGQGNWLPAEKSMPRSRRFSPALKLLEATRQGGTRPRASWKSSVSRMDPSVGDAAGAPAVHQGAGQPRARHAAPPSGAARLVGRSGALRARPAKAPTKAPER